MMKIVTDINKLRMKCKPVNKETNIKKLSEKVSKAATTMIMNNGVGIAANQLGFDNRFFIAIIRDIDVTKEKSVRVFVNPEIISHSEETNDDIEGCMSFPKQFGTVTRWNEITIKYLSYKGGNKTIKQETYSGMNARVIQHEYDHLNGICFIDKARDMFIQEDKEEIENE